jgi:hypothetical protein
MFTKWFQAVDGAAIMSIYLAFVNSLGAVAPNCFPIFELITAVITVECSVPLSSGPSSPVCADCEEIRAENH